MTDEETELARQLVAQPWWRWMPGMRMLSVEVVLGCGAEPARVACVEIADPGWIFAGSVFVSAMGETTEDAGTVEHDESTLPDLGDPATIGCLWAMLRERWPAARAEPVWRTLSGQSPHNVTGWVVTASGRFDRQYARDEGVALALVMIAPGVMS